MKYQKHAPFALYRVLGLAVGLLLSPAIHAAELPLPVVQALKDAGIPTRSAAVVVQRVDGSSPLLRHNAESPMNPASVMKLVTTYAALEILGPAFTWKTAALADGPIDNGILAGNLYLRGSGDPRLALEQFWLTLRQIRARGIRDIGGDLVLDHSAFSLPAHDPAAFDNEPLRPYNAGPDALLVNLKSITLTLHADPVTRQVALFQDSPSEGLRLVNRLVASDEACGDWREKFRVAVDGNAIELKGVFPLSCEEKALNLSPWETDVQVERLFRSLWQELGGSLRGRVRPGTTTDGARLVVEHESPTLGEIVREINKYSNNVMARQVFLTLDAARPATQEGAERRIRGWLAAKGLSMPELALDNGSGLSRSERVSADGLARLLLAAWQSPVMPELMASLPLAGVDGTLKKRLGQTAASGRAHLKTGYLGGVRAVAGYVQDRSDRRWIVVFLLNDPRAQAGKPAIDALLRWVAEH